MAFPAAFLDELAARNPIDEVVGQYVSLTRKGGNLFGLCPFHSEKTASFSVAPDKGIYYCFGCHKGGGAVNFIMEIENLDYPDAVRFLAKRAGLEVPDDEGYRSTYKKQERLWALCKDAARFFHDQLKTPGAAAARAYIQKRALSAGTVTRFGLGYAPDDWSSMMNALKQKGYFWEEMAEAGIVAKSKKEDGKFYPYFRNRLMFPIIDIRGNIIGFGGRVLDDSKPKYLNSPETLIFNKRKNLFALNVAKKSKQGRIILVEGYMDAIALHQYGFDCAVASLGTSLTEEHANLLAKYTNQVVLIYDGDEAGQTATRRAIPMLEKTGVQVKVLRMQGAKDPDEFLKKFGADRFSLLLEQSENHIEYRLQSLRRKYDLTLDDQRVEFLKEAAQLVASLSNAVEREIYGTRAAEAGSITPEAMKLEVNKAFKRRMSKEEKKQEAVDLNPVQKLQPKGRGIRYDNVRSAMAEECLLRMILKEPEILPTIRLQPEQFSAPVLGKTYALLKRRFEQGQTVSLAVLEDAFTPEEMAHLSSVSTREDVLMNEEALANCVAVIHDEYANMLRAKTKSPEALLAAQALKKEKMGYGG